VANVNRVVHALERAVELARTVLPRSSGAPEDAGSRRRRATILVAGGPEEALLASAAALRRLGGKITRYEADEAALEARRVSSSADSVIVLHAAASGADATTLDMETDAPDSRAVFRRFRAELSRRDRKR
jgi:hypothetical protein